MATGFEIVGAVAASLEMVKVASRCLSVFNDVRHVRLQAREQKDAHLNLLIQGLRFERWCFALGIQDIVETMESKPGTKDWSQSTEFTRFKNTLGAQLRLKNRKLVDVTQTALEGMLEKFEEATGILSRYTALACQDVPEPTKVKLSTRWSKFVRKGTAQSTASSDTLVSLSSDEQLGKKSRGAISSMRWVTTDKAALLEVLASIEKSNDLLLELLEPTLQVQVSRRTEMTILDHIDYATLITADGLPDDSELRILAKIKQWQVREQKENDGEDSAPSRSLTLKSEESFSRRIHPYQAEDFRKGTLRHGDYRSLSALDGNQVMVEWKYYNKDRPVRVEQTLRLGGLVGLLNRSNLYHKFSTLPCKGLVNDSDNSRIGVVFSIGDSATTCMRSLQDFIRNEAIPAPIGQRFALAKSLATALHHLHSVHWLHKSLRSDNIICFSVEHSAAKERSAVKNGTSERNTEPGILSKPPPPLPTFHLVGWDLSRPDHPSELSETLSISTLGFQSRKEAILMYSHPETHATVTSSSEKKRPRYRPQFDIYSLGIVLLEIGLWRTIDTVRLRCQSDADFRIRLRTEYCDKLLSRMGEVYWRAVQRCLNDDFEVEPGGVGDEDFDLQVAFERDVVSELEKCFA